MLFSDCKGELHNTQALADAVSCAPPSLAAPPNDDPLYTACDGTLHHSQAAADAIPCYGEETDNELTDSFCESSFESSPFGSCDGF